MIVEGKQMQLFLRLCVCAVFLFAVPGKSAGSEQIVTLSTYHNFPPFITSDGSGLTYDLADYLTDRSDKFVFKVQLLPRKRLDAMLEKQDVIVPWVTPVWFGKDAKERFTWSGSLFEDGSVYVWNSQTDKEFSEPGDLVGHLLGGIRGYRYVGVDQLVENGQIRRQDVATEMQLLQMITRRRIDVGIAPASGTRYIINQERWAGKFKIAAHHKYRRSFLLKTEDTELKDFIISEVSNVHDSDDWIYILNRYGISHSLAMN
jgi:polar amino acid transport system substrate-binding protein